MDIKKQTQFDPVTEKNIDQWLNGHYDEDTKNQIRKMIKEDPQEATDAFFTTLSFGTAGLRGIMGVGSNRMNIYNVRAATQGLANYMLKQTTDKNKLKVFIGYDSRKNSRKFAEETARVMAGNGILAYLCKNIRPTPYVSFGTRFKQCLAGITITASHNPPMYNGYKVYWSDGGQIVPPHDQGIISEVNKITDPTMVKEVSSINHPQIIEVEEEVDKAYIEAITALQNYPEMNSKEGKNLKIVYTSLHGTGITLVPTIFKNWGFTNLSFVEKQIIPDGNFPTVHYPNPEEKEAMQLGIDLLLKTKSDICIATDPDADRVGVAVNHHGEAILLNGNQIAAICLEHICEALSKQKKLPSNAAFIKSIVTTELFQAICDSYKRTCVNVLTGFKYIAQKINEWEQQKNGPEYIYGAEESYGSLRGTYARDKDAISTSAIICEAALQAKLQGKTLVDKIDELYKKYGIYFEKVLSLKFDETKEGKEKMKSGLEKLRETPLKEIAGIKIVSSEDILNSVKRNWQTGKTEKVNLPKSDVLIYWLEDGTRIIVRPSGTEPKIKIYCSVIDKKFKSVDAGLKSCEKRCADLLDTVQKLLQT